MMIRGRFIGDPSYEYEQHEIKRMGSGNNTQEEDAVIHVKEEDRLATVVKSIDDEAMVVPRAAYIRNPAGIVTPNDGFSGLSSEKVRIFGSKFEKNNWKKTVLKTLEKKLDNVPRQQKIKLVERDSHVKSVQLFANNGRNIIPGRLPQTMLELV